MLCSCVCDLALLVFSFEIRSFNSHCLSFTDGGKDWPMRHLFHLIMKWGLLANNLEMPLHNKIWFVQIILYAALVYGCSFWEFSHLYVSKFCTAWRKCIRYIYNTPPQYTLPVTKFIMWRLKLRLKTQNFFYSTHFDTCT